MRGESWMDIRSDRQKGLSYTELGRKYHMDPRTAKRYAESPERPEYTLSEPKPTKLNAYKQIVDEWLEEVPYSAIRILEKLREMGFDGGYSIVKAYVSSRKKDLDEKATVRFETMPGKQGQMDWGFFEDHLVYEDGKWKKLYCFLMILGYSRMRYIEFVTDMSTNTLIRCHQNAFRYFGGYPEVSPSLKNGHEMRRKSGMNQRHTDAQFRQRKRGALPQNSQERTSPGWNAGALCCRKPPNRQTRRSGLLPGWDTALSGSVHI